MSTPKPDPFDRLLADNARALRWLDPTFDTAEQRRWLNHYREFLRRTYADADFAGIADAAQQVPMALARIYVPERFTAGDLTGREAEPDFGRVLDEAGPRGLERLFVRYGSGGEPEGVAGAAVLIGAPGAGKSTLVRLLAVACSTTGERLSHARHLGRRMVVPLILRELDLAGVRTTDDLLARWAARVEAQSRGRYRVDLDHARAYLEQGWAIAAFDGVDEVSRRYRRRLRRLVYAFRARYPKAVVLVTGRPVGFERLPFDPPRERLWNAIAKMEGLLHCPPPIPHWHIAPFSDEQIARYVGNWYAARYPEDATRQTREREALLGALGRHPGLAGFKRRPVYLASLTYVHDVKRKLPRSEALAYQYMVEAYLDVLDAAKRFRDEQRPEEAGPDFSAEDKWRVLEWLAHDLHTGAAGTGDEDRPFHLRIGADAFDAWLEEKIEGGELRVGFTAAQAADLRRYLQARAGLLVEPEPGVLAFSHLSFQEFLAAAWIHRRLGAHTFEPMKLLGPELLDRIEDPAWHPVGLDFFGIQTQRQGETLQADMLEHTWLADQSSGPQREAARFGFLVRLVSEGEHSLDPAFLQKIWSHYFEAALPDPRPWRDVFAEAVRHWPAWGKHTEQFAVGWLSAIEDPLEPQALGGLALLSWVAKALEARLGQRLDRVRKLLAGAATKGSVPPRQRLLLGDALAAVEDPRPGVCSRSMRQSAADPRRIELTPLFDWVEIPAGTWRLGDAGSPYDDELIEYDIHLSAYRLSRVPVTNNQFHGFVSDDGYHDHRWWSEAGLAWLKESRAAAPALFHHPRLALPNRPVVGVCWYEAQAFCAWAAARLGLPVRLPGEAEWERAARGPDGRRFPWGEDWDPERANCAELGFGETCAAGLFPEGASAEGLLDLAGNVWEWTASLYQPYPVRPGDERDDPGAEGARVLRGGSFVGDVYWLRGADRSHLDPVLRRDFVGFRVCCSSSPVPDR